MIPLGIFLYSIFNSRNDNKNNGKDESLSKKDTTIVNIDKKKEIKVNTGKGGQYNNSGSGTQNINNGTQINNSGSGTIKNTKVVSKNVNSNSSQIGTQINTTITGRNNVANIDGRTYSSYYVNGEDTINQKENYIIQKINDTIISIYPQRGKWYQAYCAIRNDKYYLGYYDIYLVGAAQVKTYSKHILDPLTNTLTNYDITKFSTIVNNVNPMYIKFRKVPEVIMFGDLSDSAKTYYIYSK